MKKQMLMAAGVFVCLAIAIQGLADEPDAAVDPSANADSSGEITAVATEDPAVERTRKTVRMLDGIYKGGIVLITEHYVTGSESLPAGTAFKKLFEAAKTNGWHEVRLLDGTGDAVEEENYPADAFEKSAMAKIVAGDAWVEEIIEKDGKPYLRALTAVPVVMEKCTMCHSNYEDLPPGKAIGALGYTIPIE